MIAISQPMQRKALALLILFALIVVAWFLLIGPLFALTFGESEGVQHSLEVLARYEGLIQAEPVVSAQVQSLEQQNAASSGLVEGNSDALAAATMLSAVKSMVEQNGGNVLSSQNLPAKLVENFQAIEIQYDVTLPPGNLRRLLYQLETHRPFLFLDDVNMRVPEAAARNADAPLPAMEIQLTVRGYRWAGAR